MSAYDGVLFWFRRDLRDVDNAGLLRASRAGRRLHCALVFDRAILDAIARRDRRVQFIHRSVAALRASLRALMAPLEQQASGCIIGRDYPAPIVDHAVQRGKALALYARAN